MHTQRRQNTARTDHKRQCSAPTAPNDATVVAKKSNGSGRGFVATESARAFRRAFYKSATAADWNDWHWQIRNRLRRLVDLDRVFVLSDGERAAVKRLGERLPLGITPYYASLMSRVNPFDPLRRTHIPVEDEWRQTVGESIDPLGEDGDTVAPGLVHRYPNRVLFLATGFCATYCRYCTRSRMVGSVGGAYTFSTEQWVGALNYIEQHREIRDVLISGGDPLTLSDEKLEYLLNRLSNIAHVEFIRIGTKIPIVLPMRITTALVRVLKRSRRLWMSVHVTHAQELTPQSDQALSRLADAGIPLGSQTVLLKDVNDTPETMTSLMHGLLHRRVRPYYLYACDPIAGSSHFRMAVSKGVQIIEALRGHTSGYAVPHFVIDAPGGGGKIPLLPKYVVGRDERGLILRNFEGRTYAYPDFDVPPDWASPRNAAAPPAPAAEGASNQEACS